MLRRSRTTRRTFSSVKTIILPDSFVVKLQDRADVEKLRSRSPRFPALMRYIMEKPLLMP